jgi:hypothetical protein
MAYCNQIGGSVVDMLSFSGFSLKTIIIINNNLLEHYFVFWCTKLRIVCSRLLAIIAL